MTNLGIFIDLSNLYYSVCKKWEGMRIDYEKYTYRIMNDFHFNDRLEIKRAIAYGTETKYAATQFKGYLKAIGYEPKYKQSKLIDAFGEQKRSFWEVGLTVEILSIAPKLDGIIIGSNNQDLIPLLEKLHHNGIRVGILACGIPKILKSYCDEWLEISEEMLVEEKTNEENTNLETS